MLLETNQLILRKLTENDYEALCKILQDPEVMYAYEHAFSDEESKAWLQKQLQRYEDYGIGLWGVVLKETGELIGQCGLTLQPYTDLQVLEVGYLFMKEYWNHGYATEAARACIQYGFDVLDYDMIYAFIRENNVSSLAVAKKLHMVQIDRINKHYYNMDMPHIVMRVRKNQF